LPVTTHLRGSVMQTTRNPVAERQLARRRRIVANGRFQFIADLPREMIALLDEIKERRGLRNRGQVLEQLIQEKGRTAAQ
jgi:hypothetical protein